MARAARSAPDLQFAPSLVKVQSRQRSGAGPIDVSTLSVSVLRRAASLGLEGAARRGRGRPPRTDGQRAAHRARLIEAAMGAVRTYGPDVSIEDMADAAGVSKPVLYSEFGGKLGVVDAIALVLADGVERTVVASLAATGVVDADGVISAIVAALISLIEDEPQLYGFFVRSIRTSDRGFLDNALVRVIHERVALVVGYLAPELPKDELSILTDGVFGFVFAVVESWLPTKKPDRERLVRTISAIIRAGLMEAESVHPNP